MHLAAGTPDKTEMASKYLDQEMSKKTKESSQGRFKGGWKRERVSEGIKKGDARGRNKGAGAGG